MENVINIHRRNFPSHLSSYGDADFDISLKSLYYQTEHTVNGTKVNKKAIVRTDTNQCLGIVGPRYKAINHRDMIDNQRSIIGRSGLDTDNIREQIVTDRNGARCYVTHTLPNEFLETPDGDTAALTFLGVNSFDGLFSFMISAGARQSACMNGQIFTEGSSSLYKSRHTQQLDIHKGSRIVAFGLEVMMQQNELWKRWYNSKASADIINDIFSAATGMNPSEDKRFNNKNFIQLNKLYRDSYSQKQGHNLWAVYNSLTHWATHCQSTRKGSSTIAMKNRRANKVSEVISNDRLFREVA